MAVPGDPVEVLSRPLAGVTVTEAMRAFYGDAALMRRLLDVPERDPVWDEIAERVLGVPAAGRAVPDRAAT